MTPSLVGFLIFLRDVVGISTIVLPDGDGAALAAYEMAEVMVPLELRQMSPAAYTMAIYNLGTSFLILNAHDQPGQVFFSSARKTYQMNALVSGTIASASDNGTSNSLAVGTGLSNLQLFDLQHMKNPYGRTALAAMQTIGTSWGMS